LKHAPRESGEWLAPAGIATGAFPRHTEKIPSPLQESGNISKRKPPSQRAEQKKDETALEIARMREQAKVEKTPKPGRLASAGTNPPVAHAGTGAGHRMSNAAASSVRTKRQKSG
jgi:hypothetical protein